MDECKPWPWGQGRRTRGRTAPRSRRRTGAYTCSLSAQRQRFLWDKVCFGVVQMLFMAGQEGVFRRLGVLLVPETTQVELRSGRV
jgi:hypothetical protein